MMGRSPICPEQLGGLPTPREPSEQKGGSIVMCGCGKIYNGNFSDTLIEGDGVTAILLKKNGIRVLTEEDL